MNKIQLEKVLREYKIKKSIVDTTEARIHAYLEAISNPDLVKEWSYSEVSREPGMPGAPLRNTSSPIEREICALEMTTDTIKTWIADDRSRIYKFILQVNLVEGALKALTEQERYIIGLKYFERMSWSNIELSFNKEFKQKNDITSGQARTKNDEAIKNLLEILSPLESTFN